MASSSTPTLGDFSMLLSDNIINIEQQPSLNIPNILAPYKLHFPSEYEWMNGCIDTYGKLACDETAIYAGILTLISAISNTAFYVDECNGQERPINLYVHIIGEPGMNQNENMSFVEMSWSGINKMLGLFQAIDTTYVILS